jgi:hypothetical protein
MIAWGNAPGLHVAQGTSAESATQQSNESRLQCSQIRFTVLLGRCPRLSFEYCVFGAKHTPGERHSLRSVTHFLPVLGIIAVSDAGALLS